jgi:fatty acid desaturase
MFTKRSFFRYSPYDVLPALGGVAIVVLILWTFLAFSSLSPWVLALAFIAVMWSYCWNLQCISHNFIHNPYFSSPLLNRAYGVLETIALGVPHILYHHYHMNHHFGDNDAKGPDGTTKDWSSIYRHGKRGQPEAFWRYCLVSFFRVELGPVIRVVINHGRMEIAQAVVESVVLAAFWLTMILVDWRYFVAFYLPSYYLGWVLSYAEGYLEHFRCQPGNYFANSVSSYNWLYNFFWFNNGYHQEHHWDPKVHWTRMRSLSQQIEPQMRANQTRILHGPHLTAFIEDWFTNRRKTNSRHKPRVERKLEAA